MDPNAWKDVVGVGGVFIVIGLVEVCKKWVKDERYYPLLALGWGLALNLMAAYGLKTDPLLGVLYGVIAGLAGAGLYDVQKATRKGPVAPPPEE